MRKHTKHKNRIFKRVVSITLTLAFIFTGMSIEMISEDIVGRPGLVMTVKAEETSGEENLEENNENGETPEGNDLENGNPDETLQESETFEEDINEIPETGRKNLRSGVRTLGLNAPSINAEELAELTARYSANAYSFTSGGTELSEYSKCFWDSDWAADHANDVITLNPVNNTFIFDSDYNPIGNESSPFNGTIIYNTSANDFVVEAYGPIFDYVLDSVTLGKIGNLANIPININRKADVGSSISPLFAVHLVGNRLETAAELKVTLNSDSAHSYSGVIYEMTNGAKVNLTFADNSSHTPGTDADGNIISGSIIDNKEDDMPYGILCGSIKEGSILQSTYTKTYDDNVTFVGTGTAYAGGLVGEINGATFELLSGSSATKVDFQSSKNHVGFICGHAEDGNITLPSNYAFSGSIDGIEYAGGIAGYCKNTAVNASTGGITLDGCKIKNGTTTGGVFGYYESDDASSDILLTQNFVLTGCTVEGTGINGGIAGEYKPSYSGAIEIDLDKYSVDSTTELKTGTSAGGVFGKFTPNGNVTVIDSDTTNTHFNPPTSSVKYGGVIGEYVNTNYSNTLTLSGFTIDNLNSTATGSVGGVIGTLTGSTYVSVNNVGITNVTADSSKYFGGIVSTLDTNNAGSFIDVNGNFTFSMATGKKYMGGAIAGSFKKGVIRLAGVTDIRGAQAANGYAQLVYENDETLVYAKGDGSDSNWTFIRNADTTASDLGQWGEVIRMFTVSGTEKNAEDAGIVSVANNKVTIAAATATPTISDEVSFAKVALNMQLNDGSDHGPLCFTTGGAVKSSLLSSDITVSGTIDLADTGLLGLMRDIKTSDIFTGKIIGATGQTNKITLAVGDDYGVGTGGNIYLSYGNSSNGHNAQGLLAYSQSANVSDLTVDGTMNINCLGIGDSLYAGAVSGYVTGGISLSNVTANPIINFNSTKSDSNVYIGGVAGIYDDNKAATGFTVSDSSITPTIYISGNNALAKAHRYGGVLGYLNGSNGTAYDFTIENSTLTPVITIADGSAQQDEAYIGGLIAMVGSGKQQTITIQNTNITNADISTKSKNAGGLLGHRWENVNVSIDDLSVTGSSVNNSYSSAANNGGLVFASHGVWDVKSISIDASSSFTTTSGNSFGLLVNEGYNNNNGLYLKVKNSGLNYAAGITVTEAANMDEICAKTAASADKVVSGGDSVGVISIDMNSGTNTETKVTETGTYQNKIAAFVDKKPNSLSRYYYGLQLMKENAEASGGEQFLLWSVRKYASSNIKNMFKNSDDMISSTDIDLSGLSYYPIATDSVTLPNNSTVTFGFNDVKDAESNSSFNTDSYSRNPDDTGSARNQHYLMQTGLFTTVNSLAANALTLTGDFGYVQGAASGALINKSTSGSVSLTGLILDGLKPSNTDAYMLVNYIDGTGTATPVVTVSNLRTTNYNAQGITLPVAKSLFGTAKGQNMTMTFSDIKLDARDGQTISDSGWTTAAATAMNTAYGTSRSIFSTATFFTSLQAAKTSSLEYNYSEEEDWGTGSPRNVTYGKEVTLSIEYAGGEKNYYIVGSGTGNYTNPVEGNQLEFDFSNGFLPYVGNFDSDEHNDTYPVKEIKVNYKVAGLVIGCGTYNDPYIISTPAQLELVASAVNGVALGSIRLPNTMEVASSLPFASTWHEGQNGDGLYNISGSNYVKDDSNSSGLDTWTTALVRNYLASAYYIINADLTDTNSLSAEFPGIGIPGTGTAVNGNYVFHGVIVGKKSNGSAPTITNPSGNPLIYISNGSVVKNLNIQVTSNVSRSLANNGDNALYGYKKNNSTDKGAEYYGGVIGEIMGGDNIVDDVTVTYSGTINLSGNNKHLIAEGGMVGAVVNGALIFRGSNSVTGRNVTGGGIYSNPYVGRVINGYAVYESISGKNGTAPQNGNNYPIDTIDRSNTNKLDVNFSASTITVPDAQSLYIMSLITQSIAGTANNDTNTVYGSYSPSYGYNGYLTGVARLGDYSDVGCGAGEQKANHADYNEYAYLDSVNNYTDSNAKNGLMNAPIPYIVYRYTKRYGSTADTPAVDFPARKMTSVENKFWVITLDQSTTFGTFDNYKAFRGIGSVGLNSSFKQSLNTYSSNTVKSAMKVAAFDGNNNTLKLHIYLPRYTRDKENYYHKQNVSLSQTYNGHQLDNTNYGHDGYLESVMGLGLFDCVMVNNASDYQFKNITLQGLVEDRVYDNGGNNITGTTAQTQLFAVGGIVGKRVYGNDYNLCFNNITFDDMRVSGSYSCGGLIGIDAIKKAKKLEITGCNSVSNGISVIGGYYGKESNKIRHGIGSFVGMTFWCRPYIDGKTATSDTSDIAVSNVSSYYNGDYMSSVGGLIGYSGSGAEIKNVNLVAANSDSVIGGEKVSNAAGFIGFTQAMTENKNGTTIRTEPNSDDLNDCVFIENCTIRNLSIKAKNGAAGFVSKTGNDSVWHTKYIYISDCAVIGDAENKPEIKAYGTGTATQTNCVGGLVGDLRSSVVTCLVQNSYIENYVIEGWHVGGLIGETTNRPVNLKNLYVNNCEIRRNNASTGAIGGIVGYSDQNLNGYDLKTNMVSYTKKNVSNYTDCTLDAGIILGENSKTNTNLVDKFIGIGAYHTDASKVPTSVVKTNGTNAGNLFVFADYSNASAADIVAEEGVTSTFGNTNNVDQPVAPFLTVAPHMGMGTGEYLTGDGASIGVAGEIYKDAMAGMSNRRYTVGTTNDLSSGKTDDATLTNYINSDGTYKDGVFKISKASDEFGELPEGVEDFAMLVINDDTEKANDITPFIKSYIRLVTNAAGSVNSNKFSQHAYSCGNTNIDSLYRVVINPCYYDTNTKKFILGSEGTQGLQMYDRSDPNQGRYWLDSSQADSASDNPYQFSLIDVQFKDPTDSTKIAYHLYVPVYTKKMLTVEFSAVSMSETKFYRRPYAEKIASELAAGRTTLNPSQLVESTNEWTTTFIRYTYPKNQVSSNADWNYDKSIKIGLDSNFSALPNGTELILVDPNANSDKFYTLTLDGTWTTGTDITLDLSRFVDSSGDPFTPQNLSAIYADESATGTENGTPVLYEDYYISMYVPMAGEGYTHSILISSGNEMSYVSGEEVNKAKIDSKLYSLLVLGDLFEHKIVENSFQVLSGDGSTYSENFEMTDTNNVLKTNVTATVQIKNQSAGAYLAGSSVYHSFFITLTSHDEEHKVSDIIYGITPGYINNTTTYRYTKGSTDYTETVTNNSSLGANYIELDTGNILNALYDATSRPVLTIESETIMTFNDVTAFPYNVDKKPNIGTQVSVKSSLAYRPEDLRFSALNVLKEDPDGSFFYSTTRNNAELSFNAVPTDDTTDEIGYKTNNRSLLGVNGKYGTSHPVIGRSLYNVDDIVDYESATDVQYTIELYKKVTDENGNGTRYVKVDNISDYMTEVDMEDTKVDLIADRTTNPSMYVYTGEIDHDNPLDSEKMFEATFSCKVLTGDATHNEYANYKIQLTAQLIGPSSSWKDAYLIYTNAKIDPSVIDEND